jgi:hypothetical protein
MFKVLVPAAVLSYIVAMGSTDLRSAGSPQPRMTPRPDGIKAAVNVNVSRHRAESREQVASAAQPSIERIRGNVADLFKH